LLYLLVGEPGGSGFHPLWSPITLMLRAAIGVNAMLAVFNLIPLPPLAGGRVLVGLLPVRAAMAVERIEPYGVMILFLLIMVGIVNQVVGPLTWVTIRFVMRLAVAVVG
ncbi:MAG: site-2 protease family protein, partial [Deltaproteobacteria bacterium]|nr:site-2 protease family protein [Deltaproteobacteria bacterium]